MSQLTWVKPPQVLLDILIPSSSSEVVLYGSTHLLAMHMALQFALPLVLILWPIHIYHPFASADPVIAETGCRSVCGSVNISYPFGTGDPRCYLDKWFEIECRKNNSGIKKPFLKFKQLEVLKINVSSAQVVILNPISRSNCESESQNETKDASIAIDMRRSPFVYSQGNRFVGVGCNTLALLLSNDSEVGGCFSFCDQNDKHEIQGSCQGRYCCDTSLPKFLLEYNVTIGYNVTMNSRNSNDLKEDCSYAIIADENWIDGYSYYIDHESGGSLDDLENLSYVPAVLEWEILDSTPQFRDTYSRTCSGTNILSSEKNRTGFRCWCNYGFEGNPYVSEGCAATPSSIIGRPVSSVSLNNLAIVGVFSAIGSILFVIGIWWLYKILRRKEKYFKQNGGLLLKQKLSSGEINFNNTKLFNSKDIEKATDHFNVNRVLGKGGQGTVYKGMLVDGQIVAVKKFKVKGNVEEFINEVVILSQINHRNVVKLLGFCLETEVPLLIYEFIPNGNLFEYLHEENEELPMTWEMRLRIASEVAGALFYLHSAAAQPIYHRDIKSTNILLDEKYRAKVADFGTSRMVSIEATHLTTRVQGTFGYLDPEYYHTNQFTDKSDVYSFGVVLVELLTGKKPISSIRSEEEEAKNLASYFIMCMEEDRLFDILDKRIIEGEKEEMIVVAKLAMRCLASNGRKRPTMREVTMELEGIQKLRKRSNLEQNNEEVELAKFEVYQSWIADCTCTGSTLNSKASSSSIVLPSVSIK